MPRQHTLNVTNGGRTWPSAEAHTRMDASSIPPNGTSRTCRRRIVTRTSSRAQRTQRPAFWNMNRVAVKTYSKYALRPVMQFVLLVQIRSRVEIAFAHVLLLAQAGDDVSIVRFLEFHSCNEDQIVNCCNCTVLSRIGEKKIDRFTSFCDNKIVAQDQIFLKNCFWISRQTFCTLLPVCRNYTHLDVVWQIQRTNCVQGCDLCTGCCARDLAGVFPQPCHEHLNSAAQNPLTPYPAEKRNIFLNGPSWCILPQSIVWERKRKRLMFWSKTRALTYLTRSSSSSGERIVFTPGFAPCVTRPWIRSFRVLRENNNQADRIFVFHFSPGFPVIVWKH